MLAHLYLLWPNCCQRSLRKMVRLETAASYQDTWCSRMNIPQAREQSHIKWKLNSADWHSFNGRYFFFSNETLLYCFAVIAGVCWLCQVYQKIIHPSLWISTMLQNRLSCEPSACKEHPTPLASSNVDQPDIKVQHCSPATARCISFFSVQTKQDVLQSVIHWATASSVICWRIRKAS